MLGLKCGLCKAKSYTVSGVEEARVEDRRLVAEALASLQLPPTLAKGAKATKVFAEVATCAQMLLADERWGGRASEVEHRYYDSIVACLDPEDIDLPHVQRVVARLWATLVASAGTQDPPLLSALSLGPLSKLVPMKDAVAEACIA